MTKDDILRMAREVFDVETDSRGRKTFSGDNYGVERFAALVAVTEREQCAKVCDEAKLKYDARANMPAAERNINPEVARVAAMTCEFNAATIRARGLHDLPH